MTKIDPKARTVTVDGEGQVSYDTLILATGFDYADPGVPGGDLESLYYVKNIRKAMEWDKVLDSVKTAVVIEATPLGTEMTTSLAHRGIETHLVDPNPWPLAEMADPDIMAPVEESWTEMGVKAHFNTTLKGFLGAGEGLRGATRRTVRSRATWSSSRRTRCPTPVSPRTPGSRSARPAASSSTSGWRPRRPACSPSATAPRSRTGSHGCRCRD